MELTLKPVTGENRKTVEQLEVYPHQAGYIESVRECMEEADKLDAWHPMCILDGDLLIGFTMYGIIPEPAYTRLWFDRFLIDRRYQGKGYARPAARLILGEIKQRYPDTDIYLSVYEENQLAISLYQSLGFVFTGELDTKGEKIMCMRIIRCPNVTRFSCCPDTSPHT